MARPQYQQFTGTIGRTLKESTPSFSERPHPGEDAPNVIVVLIDDMGFSHFGSFGGTIETPNIDRLAADGLRYTNFHVTPLCSPTRAALLTGRNHHEVGMRNVSNFNTGFPHMRGHISNHAATVAEVLRDRGYATFALGKWHLCPMEEASAAGPMDQWPLARGFDRYYGFLDGETDQFYPELVYDNHVVEPPRSVAEGYHLSEDLLDHGIGFIHDSVSVRPDRPFFMYLAFGATHAPHQAPEAYVNKYRGRFDEGWDVIRARWFARQQEMGLLPADTKLAPRNPGVDAWDDLPENQRRLACRLQEAYAGFLDHTDAQIGRLIETLEGLGRLDNTMIYVLSDNGASQEGGPFGVMHEMKYFNFIIESPDEAVKHIDDIGGPNSHTNYPWGWAQAGNTPFKWYKQNTHEGGVHVPLVVHWPQRIKGELSGGIRDQFHHVNDIVPTIYSALDIAAPSTYRGYEQMPVSGTSMEYSFAASDAPPAKTVQYFEMGGHRALYLDGWKAVTRHTQNVPYDDDRWELYHYAVDRSECNDLAGAMPEKLAEMIERWWVEAEAHNVLPLDDRTLELFRARFRDRSPHRPDRTYTYYPPMSKLPPQAGAGLGGRSWDMFATINRAPGDHGVLYAFGTHNSGISLFIQNDRLVFDYNFFLEHTILESTVPVPTGASVVGIRFRRSGQSGTVTAVINGVESGTVEIPRVMGMISSVGASIGLDHGSQVSELYHGPFPFRGIFDRLDIALVGGRPGEETLAAATTERAIGMQQ